ncbi:lasso peptide biosynthesis PqqD family chaperone [Streptomyces kanamyceticus]|uniref:Lasso peptide biosynthesis PqqD family chaperone n=1 Tax=Streptomyces kanamyceticus TaxID=1967 RepID=A0A5J6G834_STRKN|nr:lasso peptide biosynthesis PqqD family chaperone [Streptomyces kanamyceticus]QEU90165.1 lasso peptide biosynthesis PqqD family chaperone [Streptomyces kanamyceticus]
MSLTLRPDVCATDTPDGMVLLDEVTGRYWQLNGSAALVLRTLLTGAEPPDAARALRAAHPRLTAERADDDTAAITGALLAARLVVPA